MEIQIAFEKIVKTFVVINSQLALSPPPPTKSQFFSPTYGMVPLHVSHMRENINMMPSVKKVYNI